MTNKNKENMIIKKLILPLLILAACMRPAETSNDTNRLETAIKSFYDAVENGDDIKRFSFYSDSIVIMPNNGRLIKGKTNLEKAWGLNDSLQGPRYIFRIKDLNRIEFSVAGNTAYTVNEYYYTYHAEGAAPIWKKTKNVHIWRKQSDGQWKMHLDIWNSSDGIK